MKHHAYTCTFPEGCNCGASYVNGLETELATLRAEVSRLRSEANRKDCRVVSHRISGGEAWLWQGDGHDHLESLTCPVVIQPEQLRGLVAVRDAVRSLAVKLIGHTSFSGGASYAAHNEAIGELRKL